MPAILRIFPYQTDASLSVLGHIGSYDQGVGRWGRHVDLQHYAVGTLGWSLQNLQAYRYMRYSQFTATHDAVITMR